MKKFFFSVLLLAGFQSFGQSTKQISIAPTPRTGPTTKGITPLNESGLIPIQEGNTFTIAPNVSFAPRKHYFLRGALKSAGAFALSYQATKVINTGKNGTATSTNIAPAAGIGLGAGLPDMIKGLKHNKTYLTYSLYNNKQELVITKSILLTRKINGVTIDNANTDGYLKVAVIGSRAIAIPGEVNVDITEPAPQEYSGNIATTMSLDASGDCVPVLTPSQCAANEASCWAVATAAEITALGACSVTGPFYGFCVTAATIVYAAAMIKCEVDYNACLGKAK